MKLITTYGGALIVAPPAPDYPGFSEAIRGLGGVWNGRTGWEVDPARRTEVEALVAALDPGEVETHRSRWIAERQAAVLAADLAAMADSSADHDRHIDASGRGL